MGCRPREDYIVTFFVLTTVNYTQKVGRRADTHLKFKNDSFFGYLSCRNSNLSEYNIEL